MRRVLPESEFAPWFARFLPQVELEVTEVTHVTDGKLWHLAGLNLSRAWMLEGVLTRLPAQDARREQLKALAGRLRETGLKAISGGALRGRALAGELCGVPGERAGDSLGFACGHGWALQRVSAPFGARGNESPGGVGKRTPPTPPYLVSSSSGAGTGSISRHPLPEWRPGIESPAEMIRREPLYSSGDFAGQAGRPV